MVLDFLTVIHLISTRRWLSVISTSTESLILRQTPKDCICAVSEALLDYNSVIISSAGKQSESVVGYKVSYSTGNSIKKELNRQIIDLINLYFGEGSAGNITGVSRHVQ